MTAAIKWHKTGLQKLSIFIYLLILINILYSGFSQLFVDGRILKFGNTSSLHQSSCEGGDWGGFLSEKCYGEAFQDYLYELGIRANRTGQIHLSSTEQSNCSTRTNSSDVDILECGIEKLTAKRGGCSSFSVADTNDRLGSSIRNLKDKCSFSNVEEGWDQSCGSCLKRWKDMEAMHPNVGESMEDNSDVCRFSVLVTVISARIKDEVWVRKLFNCLANQNSDEGSEAEEHAEKNKAKLGLYVLIGGIIGFLLVVTLSIWIFLQRRKSSDALIKKTAWNLELLKESNYVKVPIKEVYSATKNLHPSNIIGEGTAGKVYKGLLSNNQHVAIKHITSDGETFLREVRSLSHVRHPNLTILLGYCENKGECFLIYELCPNGNLSEWLFVGAKQEKIKSCPGYKGYKSRLIVLVDFAFFTRILKDASCTGISSRQTSSWGKTLKLSFQTSDCPKLSTRKGSRRNAFELADPRLHGEYSAEAFELTFELALSCTAPKQQRPSMEQVVLSLEDALHMSTKAKATSPVTTPDWSSSTP